MGRFPVFDRLLQMLRGRTARDVARPAPAPGVPAPPAAPSPAPKLDSLVSREAILDREQRIAGYEFSLRRSARERMQAGPAARAYGEALLQSLLTLDAVRALGSRLAFVAVPAEALTSPLLDRLAPQGPVLQVSPAAPLPQLQALKALGARIAATGFTGESMPALAVADYVVVDVAVQRADALRRIASQAAVAAPGARVLARGIESYEGLEVCAKLGFHLFQGSFLGAGAPATQPRLDASRMHLCDLLNRVRRDAETAELAKLLKRDPIISFKLLRYINSAAGGLQSQVASIDQALVILGRQKFYRWLTLLLFTAGDPDPRVWALMENALVRARQMELLAASRFPAGERDNLFLVGIFSLLDRLFGVPMAQALAQLRLPEPVQETLLQGTGPYAPWLALAVACESADDGKVAEVAAACGLDLETVNVALVDALAWVQEINPS